MTQSPHTSFDTTGDHLLAGFRRCSITPVPSPETELYLWGCVHQERNWVVLDWKERRWRTLETASDINAPGARHAPTATHFSMRGESYIAVLGGSSVPPRTQDPPFEDVYIYDVRRRTWVPPSSESHTGVEPLTPRLFHSATWVEIEYEPYLVVFGGIFHEVVIAVDPPIPVRRRTQALPELRFYHLRLGRWSQPVYVPGRYRHNAALIPGSGRDPKLIVMGGRDAKGNLSSETIIVDVCAAFRSLKSPNSQESVPEDHGKGVYWSFLTDLVQPLGPYITDCHLVPYGNSLLIIGCPDVSPSSANIPWAGWALSFSFGSTSYRELGMVRQTMQMVDSIGPGGQMKLLWCGILDSGWETSARGREDVLMIICQIGSKVHLIPILLSAMDLPRSEYGEEPRPSLAGLVPPLWDIPTSTTFTDFLLRTSTPNAPLIPVHRNILLSSSTYFQSLLFSGLSESQMGQATVEESYLTTYALVHWIYTHTLPVWLEAPDTCWSGREVECAQQAGETLCELLVAANMRMLPALVKRVRVIVRSRYMHTPALAPLIWRAALLTNVDNAGDLEPASDSAAKWIGEAIRAQIRPDSDGHEFWNAVVRWCSEDGADAMNQAQEWLEPEVWDAWVRRHNAGI